MLKKFKKLFYSRYYTLRYKGYPPVILKKPSLFRRVLDFIDTKIFRLDSWKKGCDNLHHAPACPANHYHFKQRPFGPCTCGARKQNGNPDKSPWTGFWTEQMVKNGVFS